MNVTVLATRKRVLVKKITIVAMTDEPSISADVVFHIQEVSGWVHGNFPVFDQQEVRSNKLTTIAGKLLIFGQDWSMTVSFQ